MARPSTAAPLAPALALGLAASLLGLGLDTLAPSLELATLDLRFQARGRVPASADILLVEIDDDGLDSISRWTDFAEVFSKLQAGGARLVLSDIIFARPGADAEVLVEATKAGRVVHPVAVELLPPGDWPAEGAIGADDGPVPPGLSARLWGGALPQGCGPLAVDRVLPPYAPVVAAAAGVGHVGVQLDTDGVFRRFPLVVSLDGKPLPSLPLAAFGVLREEATLRWDGGVEVGGARIPTDATGAVLLDYGGGWEDGAFASVTALDVLAGKADVKGKICIVGVTGATGNTDLAQTPFDAAAPKVLGLATLLDQLLGGRFLRAPGAWLRWLLSVGLGLLVAFAATRRRALALALAALGLGAAVVGGALLAFSGGLVVPTVAPLLALAGAGLGGLALRLAAAERARRKVVGAFGRYVSPAVLDKVMEAGPEAMLRGERKELSILFSDIVAFSSFCDGVLAFFGDPLPQPDHAVRAVEAARDMLRRVEVLNARWAAEGRHTIAIRIGINTGSVVVGNVGALERLEYTVLGSQVNQAQRLEAASKAGHVLVGQRTYDLIRERFPEARSVGEVAGKRDERIEAYELDPGA